MSKKKEAIKKEATTEERIKQAARTVFHHKGYAATRTRDIAEEAGINLALLNYYFRSKEKLFEIIMFETFAGFLMNIPAIINDESTSLEEKLQLLVQSYIDMLVREPEIVLFVINEVHNNADRLADKLGGIKIIMQSVLMRQYRQAVEEGKIDNINFLHFMMNLLGMVIFPFIGKPMVKMIGGIDDEAFNRLMQERKTLIPGWIKRIFKE